MSHTDSYRWLVVVLVVALVCGGLTYLGVLLFPSLFPSSPEAMLAYAAPPTPLSVTLPPANTNQQYLDKAETLYEEGKAIFDEENWKGAIKSFDEVLVLNPHHAAAYNFRGAAYRHIGASQNDLDIYLENNDRAILDFTRAIAADPEWWRPYNNRGNSYENRAAAEPLRVNREQWMALAQSDYERALALDATEVAVNCNVVSTYISQQKCEIALEYLQLCSAPESYFSRQSLLSKAYRCMGDYEQALSVLNEALGHYPDDQYFLWDRGELYCASGAYEQAEADYVAAIETWEGAFIPGMLWYDRAAAAYHLGQYDLAKEYIEQGQGSTWIDWGEPYYYLGQIYLQEGEEKQARDAFLWAEKTLDAGPLLEATQQELAKLEE